MCGGSHVLQLSLNFVEDVVLHLFVFAVTCVRTVTRTLLTLLRLVLCVELLAEVQGRLLLLLNVARELIRVANHVLLRLFDEAVRQLGWTEGKEIDLFAVVLCGLPLDIR